MLRAFSLTQTVSDVTSYDSHGVSTILPATESPYTGRQRLFRWRQWTIGVWKELQIQSGVPSVAAMAAWSTRWRRSSSNQTYTTKTSSAVHWSGFDSCWVHHWWLNPSAMPNRNKYNGKLLLAVKYLICFFLICQSSISGPQRGWYFFVPAIHDALQCWKFSVFNQTIRTEFVHVIKNCNNLIYDDEHVFWRRVLFIPATRILKGIMMK